MRVLLKTELDCSPDAAWRAIRDPRVFAAVSAPLRIRSLQAGGMPRQWGEQRHLVRISLGGVALGEQAIDVRFPHRRDGVRVLRDAGGPLSGALAPVTRWQHDMAVSAAPGGRTLYRDRLIIEAGPLTPLLWLGFWLFWQWRVAGLRRLARTW